VVTLRGKRKRASVTTESEEAMIDVEAQAAGLIRRLKGKQP
jgi:hypothetical protein